MSGEGIGELACGDLHGRQDLPQQLHTTGRWRPIEEAPREEVGGWLVVVVVDTYLKKGAIFS